MRSGFVESRHRGSVVVLSAGGAVTTSLGAVDVPVLPRSSNKPLQAVALLECGWDPADDALALAVASHSGEPQHLDVVRRVLADAGLDECALQNPPMLPLSEPAAHALLRGGGAASSLTMNCSGKHAGMLAACVASGWDVATYRSPRHPLQQHITGTLERLAGEPVTHVAVDGCGAPQHALTLTGLARGFLALVDASPGTPERRVADAARKHPELVGGTDREVTAVMRAVPGLLAKDGAESVYAAAVPGVGAVALKVEDGAWRAAPVALTAALRLLGVPERHGVEAGVDTEALDALARPPVRGGGQVVGELRPAF
ncbi:MAG TPA: asparaginase [Mycobacteriales bacterium]|nr:asparaginase [Mycobacteriales bacterium]